MIVSFSESSGFIIGYESMDLDFIPRIGEVVRLDISSEGQTTYEVHAVIYNIYKDGLYKVDILVEKFK